MKSLSRNQFTVLSLLGSRKGEPTAGIDVANSIGGLQRSSAYAALASLQRDNLVEAEWEFSASHPRRMFRITAEGERTLHQERAKALTPSDFKPEFAK